MAWLPIEQAGIFGPVGVAVVISLITASVVALSVPGALMPISFSGGVLLGWPAVLAVAVGAAVGCHLLFLTSRTLLREPIKRRFGDRIATLEKHLGKKGVVYLIGLRLTGVPHLLVGAACALTPMRARTFAVASAVGMLPAITFATIAGSAI